MPPSKPVLQQMNASGTAGALGGALSGLAPVIYRAVQGAGGSRETAKSAREGAEQIGGGLQAGGLIGGVKEGLGAAGGAIGTALGGPIGGTIGQELGKMLPDMLMAPFTAAKSLKDAFDSVVTTVRPFVDAFAPSTVMAFDQAMRDINAVIGSALVPVMQSATNAVRSFGDAILPAIRQLEPVVRATAEVFDSLLTPYMNQLGGILLVTVDTLKMFLEPLGGATPLLQGMLDQMRAVNTIFVAGVAATMELTSAFMRLMTPMGGVGNSLTSFSLQLLRATAMLAKLAGADSFIASMRKALGEGQVQGSTVGFAAAKDAKVETVPSWVNTLATNAAVAAGQVGKSPEDQFRTDALAAIDGATASIDTFNKLIEEKLAAAIAAVKDVPAKVYEQFTKRPMNAGSHIRQNVQPDALKAAIQAAWEQVMGNARGDQG